MEMVAMIIKYDMVHLKPEKNLRFIVPISITKTNSSAFDHAIPIKTTLRIYVSCRFMLAT